MMHEDSEKDPLVGTPLPALTLEGWRGGVSGMDALQGRIIVIDFWATWCQPCLGAIPHNNRIAADYADRNVVVLGICATTGADAMEQIAKDRGIQYPIAKDVEKASEKALNVRWFPCHYLVDAAGVLRAARVSAEAVEEALQTLLHSP